MAHGLPNLVCSPVTKARHHPYCTQRTACMDKSITPEGELFARLYLKRGAPAQDSEFFRNRLDAYLWGNH